MDVTLSSDSISTSKESNGGAAHIARRLTETEQMSIGGVGDPRSRWPCERSDVSSEGGEVVAAPTPSAEARVHDCEDAKLDHEERWNRSKTRTRCANKEPHGQALFRRWISSADCMGGTARRRTIATSTSCETAKLRQNLEGPPGMRNELTDSAV